MSPRLKQALIFTVVFAVWLVADLASKDWADRYLADANHPIPITVGKDQAGKPLSQVLADHFEISQEEANETLVPYTQRLNAAIQFAPADAVFSRTGKHVKDPGYYAFWRDDRTMPPRRLIKHERRQLSYWVRTGDPQAAAQQIAKAVQTHLDTVTFSDWLTTRIPALSHEDVSKVSLHPISFRSSGLTKDSAVAAGETYLVTERRIDVHGEWFKYVYAENTGAAFGFMRSVEPGPRSVIFFILTLVALIVILSITWRVPPDAWLVNLAMSGILSGAAGNFINRMQYEYVVDFIDMDLGFMHWPTYNVADIAISIGVILLAIDMFFNKDSVLAGPPPEKKEKATS